MNRIEIIEKAKEIVCGDRDQQYGTPENSFAEIAALWSDYLGEPIDAKDVAIMMALFKIARIKTGVRKDDSYIDAVGYIACAAEIASEVPGEIASEVPDRKPIKSERTCNECRWGRFNECHDHESCRGCERFVEGFGCECNSVIDGDECPRFEAQK